MTNPERVRQFMIDRLGRFTEQAGLVDAIVAYGIECASAEVERRRAVEGKIEALAISCDKMRTALEEIRLETRKEYCAGIAERAMATTTPTELELMAAQRAYVELRLQTIDADEDQGYEQFADLVIAGRKKLEEIKALRDQLSTERAS